ncbi:unnamed protein product [Phytophthora fragariaefolia]|uniref:Unnamed protein product n=1 Tax=Phytophthora fragariaefolia TaxID=1490495 RepID=A0A9W6XC32_9STRA|nr:unnamed protein product [Phytophthora fragariaefolia]
MVEPLNELKAAAARQEEPSPRSDESSDPVSDSSEPSILKLEGDLAGATVSDASGDQDTGAGLNVSERPSNDIEVEDYACELAYLLGLTRLHPLRSIIMDRPNDIHFECVTARSRGAGSEES